ncbi:hypothetical protein SAMN06265365_102227 [Tistlia consotensis]|uniref:Yip1 domain-containing protein n=1 Tax=Tistlia consotensis USBA 355 TaxID=560819 RepID=A0A1Y6BHF3_9PROT|nr:YIP1 family protein [Tistlia consotensis]SMF07753.1 hypothetical protein SAMN05428998_10489 [Tistlia consotensis USBA 355]SNR35713.1 hypothetical protein SAMN06265365_102227 [Tistlia consotensis]
MTRPTLSEAAVALWAAGRLLRFDPVAWRTFDDTPETFWKSFWAALPVLPLYLLMITLHLSDVAAAGRPVQAGWLETALIVGLAYVISWTAYPLVLFHLTRAMGKERRFVPLVAAMNWLNVPLSLIGTLAVVISELDLLGNLSGLLRIGAQIYVLVCMTQLVVRTLDLRGFPAFGVVLIGVVIDYFLLFATTATLI